MIMLAAGFLKDNAESNSDSLIEYRQRTSQKTRFVSQNSITSMHGKFWRTRRPSNHSAMNRPIIATALLAFCFACTSCGGSGKPVVAPGNTSSVLNDYHLAGATSPVRDPEHHTPGQHPLFVPN